MILYLSAVAAPSLYLSRLDEGALAAGFQVQRFNLSLVQGLAARESVVALSALPYLPGVRAERDERSEDGVRFISVACSVGLRRKISNITSLVREGTRLLKARVGGGRDLIICDAVSHAASAAALRLSKKFKIPAVAIVTDLPEVMYDGKLNLFGRISARLMKKYSAYVLLTEAMNEIANPARRPYIVMEGLCAPDADAPRAPRGDGRRIIVYSGSLWREAAGIEMLIEGFRRADIADAELEFYGKGELVPEIERIAESDPRVRYMGSLDNQSMARRLREVDLLVNPRPSSAEFCKYSFPSKTMDYMASGVPVLMTRLPGLPSDYRERVFFIEDETPDGVAAALERVLLQSDEALLAFGDEARRFVLSEKNHLAQTARLLDFFESEKLIK